MQKFLNRPFTTRNPFCGQFSVLCPVVGRKTQEPSAVLESSKK